MITNEVKKEYLDFFNAALQLDLEVDDLKMATELDKNNQPIAAIGFFNSSQYNMEICIAAKPKWTTSRKLIRQCFEYAFVVCGARRITSYIKVGNEESIGFIKRLGAVQEFDGVLKNWFGDEDGLQFVIFKENCNWIKEIKNESV